MNVWVDGCIPALVVNSQSRLNQMQEFKKGGKKNRKREREKEVGKGWQTDSVVSDWTHY